MTYEGYGSSWSSRYFVDTLTDNLQRTVINLVVTWVLGSLAFLFDHKCVFIKKDGMDMEELILDLIGIMSKMSLMKLRITIYGDPKIILL